MALVSFVLAYFASKNLSLLTAFVCWSPEEALELWRGGRSSGVRVAIEVDFTRLPALPAYDVHREGVLLDMNCPDAHLVIQKASATRAFIHRYSWLLLHNDSSPVTIDSTLANAIILPDADVTWSSPRALVDLYRIKFNRQFVVTELGLDRNSSVDELRALWRRLPTAVDRRKNLDGVIIEAASVISQPQYFRGWSNLHAKEIDTFPKFTYPLVMLCSQDMNFRLNLRQVDLYGVKGNGTFSGLVGLLQRRAVEAGLVSMFMRADRWKALHYCAETVELRGSFIFRQPAQSAVCNVFLLPFSRGVWAAAAGVLAAAAALLAAMSRAAPTLASTPTTTIADQQALSLPDTLTFIIGAICQQGFHLTPRVSSIRLVMFLTLLAAVFVFTAYSAKIVVLMQTPSDALQTIDQLAASPMHLAVQDTTYKKVFFAESSDPATQRLFRRKLVPLGERAYMPVVDGIARVRTGLFAYQVEQSSGYDIISKTFEEHEKCGLKEIKAFNLPMVSIPIVKHSGYRKLFASRVRWQRETGLMCKWRRVWVAARPRCELAGAGFLSVGLGDVLPALQILWMGALLAVVILFIEIAAHRANIHSCRLKTRHNAG